MSQQQALKQELTVSQILRTYGKQFKSIFHIYYDWIDWTVAIDMKRQVLIYTNLFCTFPIVKSIWYGIIFCWIRNCVLHWTENCTCSRRLSGSKQIGFVKISDSRTELRCGRCRGLIGWWDEQPRTRKIMPFKRAWSEEERLAMR